MMIRKIFLSLALCLSGLLLFVLLMAAVSSVSPVYDFPEEESFSGESIYNPYHSLDSLRAQGVPLDWKRANFHTHTKVDGILNECSHSPQAVYDSLASFGYDIVTFSNHNELTRHPFDTALQVNVYEHGINLLKYHKLVFGAEKVLAFDHLVPAFLFQRQFAMDLLGRQSDFIQLNHPLRTPLSSERVLRNLSGYQIMELDSGISTEQQYWDWALSSGHYSTALANDDLHYPDRSYCIAVRCNFLHASSGRYEDIKDCLLQGCNYSMRVPDYGSGDWAVKHRMNSELPYVRDIGLRDSSTVFIVLSERADSIRISGEGHTTLSLAESSQSAEYTMRAEDPYVRITAYFPGGEVIYSNPFARYHAAPGSVQPHYFSDVFTQKRASINIALSSLWNLSVLLVCSLLTFALIRCLSAIPKLWRSKEK